MHCYMIRERRNPDEIRAISRLQSVSLMRYAEEDYEQIHRHKCRQEHSRILNTFQFNSNNDSHRKDSVRFVP